MTESPLHPITDSPPQPAADLPPEPVLPADVALHRELKRRALESIGLTDEIGQAISEIAQTSRQIIATCTEYQRSVLQTLTECDGIANVRDQLDAAEREELGCRAAGRDRPSRAGG